MSIKQAIEALEEVADRLDGIKGGSVSESIRMLRDSIAALRSMPAEPVAIRTKWPKIGGGWTWVYTDGPNSFSEFEFEPLFATPHTEAVRMSEAEIGNAIASHIIGESATYNQLQKFARAVEQATAARLGVKWGDV